MTPAQQLDVLDAAVPALLAAARRGDPDAAEMARQAHRWRTLLDAGQAEVAPEPDRGVAGLLAALQRDGSACWKAAGYRSREGAKSAMKRAGVKRLVFKADGRVMRQRRGTYRRDTPAHAEP